VSFSAACATGIAVVLGDLDGSAPVTFSVVAPNGSHDSVPVRVGQLVKRTYAVTEGTTGTVSVTAPGLARKAFSYTKRCTRVLGEKVVKGTRTVRATQGSGSPAAVRGQQAQLPFTGFPAGRALLLGALLTAAGVALTLAPRRRYAGRHAA
jgi:hypothetical protein